MPILPTRATLLATRLSDLRDWHLVVTCRCRGFPQHVDLAPIAAEYGGRLTLERVAMKLRCRHCGTAPVRITAGQGDPFVPRAWKVVLLETKGDVGRRR